MYGLHSIPFSYEDDELSITVKRDGDLLVYQRRSLDATVEQRWLDGESAKPVRLLINPVEPVNLPENITKFFILELAEPLLVKPQARSQVFLTFPIEIGVFITEGADFRPVDVFSLQQPKYTLYGDVKSGTVCRHWRTDLHALLPKLELADRFRTGVVRLRIRNRTSSWIEVDRVVLNAHATTIYYDRSLVAMRASMKLLGEHEAEVSGTDMPLREKMKKAREMYTTMNIITQLTKFVLEGELV